MPNTLPCPNCATSIDKDYHAARIMQKDYSVFFSWMCGNCGQEIREKKKDPIYL